MSRTETNTPLHIAVLNNRVDEVRELLKLPETECNALNHREETPLFLSLKNKCSDELILTLIDHGVNVQICNKKGTTPLHLAVQRRSTAVVTRLIEEGASVNLKDPRNGCTPLHIAIAQGRYYNIEELFKWKASMETKNYFGQAPLVYGLCKESGDRIISTLIDHGCDVCVADNKGFTSLHYASYKKSTFIAQKLIENGANIDFMNYKGDTPLHMGVLEGNLEYVCLLLCYGASVNECNYLGKTPFHEAISFEFESIAQHLLNHIVDFNVKDKHDNAYLHMALDRQMNIVMDMLDKCDVNVISRGEHSLYTAVKARNPYDVLQVIWLKTDFDMFIPSLCGVGFLDEFCECYKLLPNEQFLEFLYIIFSSPYIEDLLDQRIQLQRDISLFHHLFITREALFQILELNERIEMILVLLSYGVEVYFEDICYLYQLYRFDGSIELLLMNGSYIHRGSESSTYYSLIVSRICYDNLDIYIDNEDIRNKYQKLIGTFDINEQNGYCRFYRAMFDVLDDSLLILHGVSSKGEVSSLLEISRNVVRSVLYQICRTSYSFNVYSAISKLPVPSVIKEILFLKRPIYD